VQQQSCLAGLLSWDQGFLEGLHEYRFGAPAWLALTTQHNTRQDKNTRALLTFFSGLAGSMTTSASAL